MKNSELIKKLQLLAPNYEVKILVYSKHIDEGGFGIATEVTLENDSEGQTYIEISGEVE